MWYKIIFILVILSGCNQAETTTKSIKGTWKVIKIDGQELHQSRARLTLDVQKMSLFGNDGCNAIRGKLIKNKDNLFATPILLSTRMACHNNQARFISQQLQSTLKEGFTWFEKDSENITLKSAQHTLGLHK